jgi:hypothetical protein
LTMRYHIHIPLITSQKDEYALSCEHLVYGLGAGKRMMIEDGLYSRIAEHVETIYLAI